MKDRIYDWLIGLDPRISWIGGLVLSVAVWTVVIIGVSAVFNTLS